MLREALQFGKAIMDSFLFLDIDNLKYYIIKDLQEKILVNDPTLLFDLDKLNNSQLHDEYSINGNPNIDNRPAPSLLDLDGKTPPKYVDNLPK